MNATLLFIAPVTAFLGLLVHEAGHAAAAMACGGSVTRFVLAPGLQFYPSFAKLPWTGQFGSISYRVPEPSAPVVGFISLMGTGATALLAILALIVLWIRPKVPGRLSLLAAAGLWPLDMISYAVFPSLGLRHWIVLGGRTAEPVAGAQALGLPAGAFFAALALFAVIHYAALRRVLQRA